MDESCEGQLESREVVRRRTLVDGLADHQLSQSTTQRGPGRWLPGPPDVSGFNIPEHLGDVDFDFVRTRLGGMRSVRRQGDLGLALSTREPGLQMKKRLDRSDVGQGGVYSIHRCWQRGWLIRTTDALWGGWEKKRSEVA